MATSTLERRRSTSPTPSPCKRICLENSPTSTMVRFLILSDTHGAELPSNLPPCDVVLHCGDLTEDGSPKSIAQALQTLSQIKAELKLVIAGKHEISMDEAFHLAEGGNEADVEEVYALVGPEAESEASKCGVTFLLEGTHHFTLFSGATFSIYASPYTPKHGASAFQYPSAEDRFNLRNTTPAWAKNTGPKRSIIPDDIDIFMTHGHPKHILDTTSDGQSAGCSHLRRALARVKPKLHCFGHIQTGYSAQRLEFGKIRE